MIQIIKKRDGREEPFDSMKIAGAIKKAMEHTEDFVPNWRCCCIIANKIANYKVNGEEVTSITVEQCQELVEDALIRSKFPDVAKEYIRYRHERNIKRKAARYNVFGGITKIEHNDVTRENANMDASTPSGQIYKFAAEGTKEFTIDELLPDDIAAAHTSGLFHIHDLDWYPTKSWTCVQHPLDKVFQGFRASQASARSPKRIETAAIIACISLQTAQNLMHGGQAIPAFDFYMAPYVKLTFDEELKKASELLGLSSIPQHDTFKDYVVSDLSVWPTPEEKAIAHAINQTVFRVHQAMESFVHNLNTMYSRGGNQTVFSSINYGTDTSAEGRCIIRELLDVTLRGVGENKTAIFPIQIWKSKSGVSYLPDDPNYDLYKLACKVSAKRFYPNFLNLDATFNQNDEWDANDPKRYEKEVATMGCRTRVFENRFGPKTSIGRGNLSFTTVNLPHVALLAKQMEGELLDNFWKVLHDTCNLAAKQLDVRFNWQKQALAKQFPFLVQKLWNGGDALNPDDTVESIINQGTLGLGFIGLAECLVALTGHHHGESAEAQKLGLSIVTAMRDWCNAYSEQYRHNYSVLATPAEGLAGTALKKDRKMFGVIPGVTDKAFYTNSNHVPVWYHITPSQKAAIEGPYHDITRAGHIFYVELDGDPSDNPEAIMRIVDLMHVYNIGYGSINYNANTCMDCGHEWTGREKTCPSCGSDHLDTLARVTGYLTGSLDRWNSGKLGEWNARVTHA